ncbi:hypothetical protein M3J09_010795 [Ascochyta lentis]
MSSRPKDLRSYCTWNMHHENCVVAGENILDMTKVDHGNAKCRVEVPAWELQHVGSFGIDSEERSISTGSGSLSKLEDDSVSVGHCLSGVKETQCPQTTRRLHISE